MRGLLVLTIALLSLSLVSATEDKRGPGLSVAVNATVDFMALNPLVLPQAIRYCYSSNKGTERIHNFCSWST